MNLKLILVFFLLTVITSCRTEVVQEEKHASLTIASDYLSPSDTILFKAITDSLNCSLTIRKFTVDQLIGHIRNNRFNSGIDLIMVKSPYDVNRLRRIEVFQPLSSNEIRNRWKDYNVVPIAIDPFLQVSKFDSLQFGSDSLNSSQTLCLFEKEDLVVLLSFNYRNTDPVVALGEIRAEQSKYAFPGQSLWTINKMILPKSKLEVYRNDSLYRQFNWTNADKLSAYNGYTVGLLNQPENYPEAIAFIKMMKQSEYAAPFMRAKGLEEIDIQNGSAKLQLEDQIQYFTQIERALR